MTYLTILSQAIKTMSSREIAVLTGKELSHVHRDIRVMLDALKEDGADMDHPQEDKDARGYTTCFYMNRDLTETLLTGYSVSARLKVIRRWRELEEAAAGPSLDTEEGRLMIIQELAGKHLTLLNENKKINQQLALAAPKVAFVERYVESTGLKSFRQVAKMLHANEARFRDFLFDKKIMYRLGGALTAYGPHLDAGRFDVRTGASEASGHAFSETKFTSKGFEWIAGEWAKHLVRQEVAA